MTNTVLNCSVLTKSRYLYPRVVSKIFSKTFSSIDYILLPSLQGCQQYLSASRAAPSEYAPELFRARPLRPIPLFPLLYRLWTTHSSPKRWCAIMRNPDPDKIADPFVLLSYMRSFDVQPFYAIFWWS